MIAKLELAKGTAGYDIIVPTGGYVPEMVAKGLMLALDKSKLPNFKNLDSKLLNFPWDPGNKYTIPKDFGTTGYIYDKTVITKKLTHVEGLRDRRCSATGLGSRVGYWTTPTT